MVLLTTASIKRNESRYKKPKVKIENKKENFLEPLWRLFGAWVKWEITQAESFRRKEIRSERESVYQSLQDCLKKCRDLAQHIVNKMQSNVEKIKREKY